MTTTPRATSAQPPRRRRRHAGFTLIETLVTVGIAAVVSGFAYPSLEGQVLRARRADALVALVALLHAQLAQEQFRASNASYGPTHSTMGRANHDRGDVSCAHDWLSHHFASRFPCSRRPLPTVRRTS